MIPTNFYVTGGTLQRDARSYVRRKADDLLYEAINQGKFCYVLTSRQMGKSSLMVRTATRLRDDGVAVAVLDLTALGRNLTPEQWYYGLLSRIGEQLRLRQELKVFRQDEELLGPLQRWMLAIQQVVLKQYTGRVVIFIDEIDAVRSLPFSTDEFFAAIRELYNRRSEDAELERLTFCLLGVATPTDLIQDTRTTPFNIGQRIELTDFTEAEASTLAQGFGRDNGASSKLLQRVIYWTNGHPYLTQRLCQAVAEAKAIADASGVDRLCNELFLSSSARTQDDNLQFVSNRMLKSEADVASLLDLYGQVRKNQQVQDDKTNLLINILKLSGITRVADSNLCLRNRIYEWVFDEEWIGDNTPGAEQRRQRAAYRKGLVRAATIAAVILLVIGGLAFTAIYQSRRAIKASEEVKKEKSRADRLLYDAQIRLAVIASESGNNTRLQELLEMQEKDSEKGLRGFEWDYLNYHSVKTLAQDGSVTSVMFSPDGSRLATTTLRIWKRSQGADESIYEKTAGEVRLWDAISGQQLPSLKSNNVIGAAFLQNGKQLISVSDRGTIRVWDANSGQENSIVEAKSSSELFYRAAFSPDGKRLALINNQIAVQKSQRPKESGIIKIWDLHGRELLTLEDSSSAFVAITFSPNGQRLASASGDGTIRLCDANTGQILWTLKMSSRPYSARNLIYPLIFSPDGERIASLSDDQTIKLWDVSSGEELLAFRGQTNSIGSLAFSPDGKRLASSSEGLEDEKSVITLWDVGTGQELIALKGHNDLITYVAFSPTGKQLVSVSGDKTIKLWDVTNKQELRSKEHTAYVNCVVFSPTDVRKLASASSDGSMKVWDRIIGIEQVTLKGHISYVFSAAFSPDGGRLASASFDGIKLWDMVTGKELLTIKIYASVTRSLAFSPDGKRLALASDDKPIALWDAVSGRELRSFQGQGEVTTTVAFSPDGKRLASGTYDGKIKLWDVNTGRELLTLDGNSSRVNKIIFSPDGKRLVSATGDFQYKQSGEVKIWYINTRQEALTFKGHVNQVNDVAFSPDGRRLASASLDGTIILWDASNGQLLLSLKGHKDSVNSVAFSSDGDRLASASSDKTVKVWDVSLWQNTQPNNQQIVSQ